MNSRQLWDKLRHEDVVRARVYIAGPMRGIPELNRPAFYAAEKLWKTDGWLVVNPARLDGNGEDMTFESRMRRDLRKLMDCHAIVMLPGWRKSEGANWEAAAAFLVGIPFFDAEGCAMEAPSVTLSVNSATTMSFADQARERNQLAMLECQAKDGTLSVEEFLSLVR